MIPMLKRPTEKKQSGLLLERLERRVLLNAVPDVTVDLPDEALIGETVEFDITFDLAPGTGPGFGPFIDVVLPRNGADGAAGTDTPDGLGTDPGSVTFDIEGIALTPVLDQIVGPSGTVEHPLLRNPDGTPVIVSGLTPGDRFIVLQLPLGSYEADSTELTIHGTANIDQLADVGEALPIEVRGGFQYGCDPLDNPSVDNPNDTVSNFVSDSVTPEVIRIDKMLIAPENETATGSNFPRSYVINIDIADGQTITDLVITDPISNRIVYLNNVALGGAGVGTGMIVSEPPINTTPLNGSELVVEYDSIVGTSSSVDISVQFDFYVSEFDADGNPILDPITGDDTETLNTAFAEYTWDPIDPRDDDVTETVVDDGSDGNQTLTNKSIAVQKSVSNVNDIGPTGPSSGDVLEYRLEFQISDYFDFQNIVLSDLLSDGQSFDASFVPMLQISGNAGATSPLSNFQSANYSFVVQPGTPYGTEVTFEVSNELIDRGQSGTLIGNDGGSPGTTGVIVFRAVIDDTFRDPTLPPDSINVDQGDTVGNNVQVSGDIVGGESETDDSSTSTQLPTGSVDKTVFAINGNAIVGTPTLSPGDQVTYRISYELPLTEFQSLTITDSLPLPIFDASTVLTFVNSVQTTGVPAVGQITYGPNAQAFFDLYSTGGGLTPTLAQSMTSNSFSLDFGTFAAAAPEMTTIDLLFTVQVEDVPFADGLFLSNLVETVEGSTNSGASTDVDLIQVQTQSPELNLKKGVVSTDTASPPAEFTPGTTGPVPFTPPGTAGPAFTTPITSADLDTDPIDSDLSGIDAGDLVKFAIVVENTGSDDAFDLIINDTLPPGFVIPANATGLNLQVQSGDGTVLAFTDSAGNLITPGTEADFFFTSGSNGQGIRLVDPADLMGGDPLDGVIDGQPTGAASGSNIIVITFDLQAAADIPVGSEQLDTATLENFAGINNGVDWTEGVDGPFTDDAIVMVREPIVEKILTGTEIDNATNGFDEAVIGELVYFDIVVTLPEGVTPNLIVTDQFNLLSEMAFVQVDSITVSGDLSTDLPGGDLTAVTPVVTNNGTVITFDFGTVTNSNADNSVAETITISVTAVVLNDVQNQSGSQEVNRAEAEYTVNGQPITTTADAAPVTVIEPELDVTKTATVNGNTAPPGSGDAGDPVEYTITLQHSGSSETDAFDVTLTDLLPTGIVAPMVTGVVDSEGILTTADVVITGGTLQFAIGGDISMNTIDMNLGRVVTITVAGTLDNLTPGEAVTNEADIAWTSLDGDPGQRSTFNTDSVERTGADGPGGALNDYADTGTNTFLFDSPTLVKFVSTTSESHTGEVAGIEQVAIGEIVRYRLITRVPETIVGAFLQDQLPDGMTFLNDGTTMVAFVGDDPALFFSSSLGSPSNAYFEDSATFDLMNGALSFVVDSSLISPEAGSTDFTSGVDPIISLGTITNNENDANFEFIVIEFNALVNNVSGNQANTQLDNVFSVGGNNGEFAFTSNTETVQVVEPNVNVEKLVVTPPVDAGDTVTYSITIENLASATSTTAFDIRLSDIFDPALDLQSVQVVSSPVATIITDNSDTGAGNFVDMTFDRLDEGQSISLLITATVLDDTAVDLTIDNTADITYTSLPGDQGTAPNPTGSVLPATDSDPGEVNGERTGDDGPNGALNDYADTSTASLELDSPTVEKFVDETEYTIGEIVTYDLLVTLPEGTTLDLFLTDNLPPGLEYVSYEIITAAALSNGLLTEDYGGTLPTPMVNSPSGSGADLELDFGNTVTAADNDVDNNSFVVRVTARVLNIVANQDGITLTNTGELEYTDPDTSTTTLTTGSVDIELIEPELNVEKQISGQSQANLDAGDTIEYTVVISHDGSSTSDAFEVAFADFAPGDTLITSVVSVTGTGFGTTTIPIAEIVPGGASIVLSDTAGSGVFDLPLGASITLVYEVTIQDSLTPGEDLTNDASIDWSSVDGDVNPGDPQGERDGSSRPDANGLNNYFDDDSVTTGTATPTIEKTLVATSVPETIGNDLVVGETATFYLTVTLPEGTYPNDFVVTDFLPTMPGKLQLVSQTYRADLSDSDITFSNLAVTTSDSNTDMLDDTVTFTFTDLVNPSAVGTNDNLLVFEIVAIVPDDPTNVDGTTITNTGTVTYPGFTDSDMTDVDIVEPVLEIEKTSDISTANVGDIVTYTLVVSHASNSTATAFDIVIDDQLLEGMGLNDKLDLVVGSVMTSTGTVVTGNTSGDTTIAVAVDSLDIGDTVTITFEAQLNANVDPTGDTVINTASVNYDSNPGDGGRPGLDTDDNEVDTPQEEVGIDKVVIRTSEASTTSDQYNPDIVDLAIGEVVTYQITLDLPAGLYEDDVILTDLLPEYLALISGASDVRVTMVGGNISLNGTTVTTSDTGTDGYDDQLTITFDVDQVQLPGMGDPTLNQIVIEVDAQVLNVVDNQATGTPLVNTATVTLDTFTDSDTALVELVEPDLEIEKQITSQSQDPPDAGDTITYQVVIQHAAGSTADAFDVVFTDIAPSDTLITSVNVIATGFATPPTAEILGGGTSLRLNGATMGQFDMPLGSSITLEYTITLSDSVEHNQVLTNDADLTWSSLEGDQNSGQETGERDGSGAPDAMDVNNYFAGDSVSETVEGSLAIEKTTLNGTEFAIGDTVVYQLTVTLFEGFTPNLNITDLVASVFTVDPSTVQVNAGSQFTFASAPMASFMGGTLSIDLGDVTNAGDNNPMNNSFTITYEAVVVNDPANANNQTKPNSVEATSDNELSDNANFDVTIVEPFLDIEKTISDTTPHLGDIVTYEFVITHDAMSTTDAYDLIIQDVLPPEVTIVPGTLMVVSPMGTIVMDSSSGNMISLMIDQLALGESITITVDAEVTSDIADYGTTFTNTATLDWDSQPGENPEQRPDETMDDAEATIVGPDLTVEKSTPAVVLFPGDIYEYDLTVTNKQGPFADVATNVIVVDTLPPGVTFVSSTSPFFDNYDPTLGTVTFVIPSMAIGESIDIEMMVQLSDPAPPVEFVMNNVDVTHDDIDPTPEDNHDDVTTPIDESVTPDLVVTKDDGIIRAFPGDTIVYDILVTNVGNQTASGVVVTDTFPSDVLDFISASNGGVYDPSTSTIEWQLGNLAGQGGQVSLTITAQVKTIVSDPTIMDFTNFVNVRDDGTLGPDPTPENNFDSDTDLVTFYGKDAFNDFLGPFHDILDDPIRRTPDLRIEPFISGIATPGSTLHLEFRDPSGGLVGWKSVVTDSGGNYFANMQGVEFEREVRDSRVWSTSAQYGLNESMDGNLRRYYEPARQMATYFRPMLSPGSAYLGSPSNSLSSMLEADARPLQLADPSILAGYELRLSSFLPAGK